MTNLFRKESVKWALAFFAEVRKEIFQLSFVKIAEAVGGKTYRLMIQIRLLNIAILCIYCLMIQNKLLSTAQA